MAMLSVRKGAALSKAKRVRVTRSQGEPEFI